MCRTRSLARMVNTLSTNMPFSYTSIFQWCLFWRVAFLSSHVATRPSILRLPCEQFRVAKPLRLLSEQPHPPCELPWTIFCEQYGINHLSQRTGTVFRFLCTITGVEPVIDRLNCDCITVMQYCEPTKKCCHSCFTPC